MIYEAPEIIDLAKENQNLKDLVESIESIIPENYYNWDIHGEGASNRYTMIMIEIFRHKGLKLTEQMLSILSEE
jgi:hypothetical protein